MHKAFNKKSQPGATWKHYYSKLGHQQYIVRIAQLFSVVEAKKVTPRFRQIDIPVCFIQEQFVNGLFVPNYEKSSVMSEDISTKPYSGLIISFSTKWMARFRFYPSNDTKHHQLIKLHEFDATYSYCGESIMRSCVISITIIVYTFF